MAQMSQQGNLLPTETHVAAIWHDGFDSGGLLLVIEHEPMSHEAATNAMREAIRAYLRTPEGAADARGNGSMSLYSGEFNWGDAAGGLPEEILQAHGIRRFGTEAMDVQVEHDENFWADVAPEDDEDDESEQPTEAEEERAGDD